MTSRAWAWSGLLLALAWGVWVTLLVYRYDFWAFEVLNRENGPVEATSALAFLLACLSLLAAAWHRRRAGAPTLGLLWLAGFLFVCLGEETSWGLQLFHFQAPGVFARYNVQRETNLHNLVLVDSWSTLAYRSLFFGFFVALPLLLRFVPALARLWARLGLGRPPLALAVVALAGAAQVVALGRVPFPDSPLRHWLAEVGETGTALVWLLYAAREALGRRAGWLLVPAALGFAGLFLNEPHVRAFGAVGTVWPSRVERAARGALVLEREGVRVGGTTSGAPLGEGAIVRADGEAALQLLACCQVRLQPGSVLRVATLRGDTRAGEAELALELDEGRLWLGATPLAPRVRLRLLTPAAVVESGAASFGVEAEAAGPTRIVAGLGPLTLRSRAEGATAAALLTLEAGDTAVCEASGCRSSRLEGESLQAARLELAADWRFGVGLLKREFTRHSQLLIQLERAAGLPRGSIVDRRARPGRTLIEDGSVLASLQHAPWPDGKVPAAERDSLEAVERLEAQVGRLAAASGQGGSAVAAPGGRR